MKILVVEDIATNQFLISSILEDELDCRVELADNGLEAIDRIQRDSYDVVLMDCQMPVMDGFEATRELRKLGYELPIIALTANALKGDKEKCLEAGMNDHVPKPVIIEDLYRSLSQFRWGLKSSAAQT